MDTKMKNETDVVQPTAAPPPYTGPSSNNPPYPSNSDYSGNPTTSQPHFAGAPQMTGVHMTTVYPGSSTIIHGSTVVPVVVNNMGPKPTAIICKSCHQQIITKTEKRAAMRTHLFAILLCIFFFPCACVPYCVDSCNNADHYCTNCNAYLGSYIS